MLNPAILIRRAHHRAGADRDDLVAAFSNAAGFRSSGKFSSRVGATRLLVTREPVSAVMHIKSARFLRSLEPSPQVSTRNPSRQSRNVSRRTMEYAAVEESLQEIVGAIVRLADPERIILFGSAARGHAGPESDLDLLVVMPDGADERGTAMRLYQEIRGVGRPFELVVATTSSLQRYRSSPGLIYGKIMRDGREVYAR